MTQSWTVYPKITRADTLEVITVASRRFFRGPWAILTVWQTLSASLLTPLGVVLALYIVPQLTSVDFHLTGASTGIVFGVSAALSLLLLWMSYQRLASETAAARFAKDQTVLIHEKGMTIRTEASQWVTGWADVEEVVDARKTIVIAVSGVGLFVPKRDFASAEDAADCLAAMQAWVAANR